MRFAIAGLAHGHVRQFFNECEHQPDLELMAVAESDPELVAKYTAGSSVPTYADHREMLAEHEVDVVGVAGIYSERACVVIDALYAGCHVIVDKPMCTTLEQLADIETAAERSGKIVSVLFDKRHYPVTVAARQLVDSGELGKIVLIAATGPHKLQRPTRPDWFFRRAEYGGVLNDLAAHDVDLALLFSQTGAAGPLRGTVLGQVGGSLSDLPEFTDYGSALLKAGSTVSTLEVSWLTPHSSPYHGDYRMRLTGTKGSAEIYFAQGRLDVTTDDRPPFNPELPPRRRAAQDAIEAFGEGRAPQVDTRVSVDSTRVSLLAQASADAGGEVLEFALPLRG
jgi:predicted dehydrogenase